MTENVPRCAAITPYYKESRELLERCIESVRCQTVSTVHFMVSDGVPQPWLDEQGLRHIRLGRSHGDYGNTPRGIGALLAASEGYDAVFFLDADNWIEPDHVEACIGAAVLACGRAEDCDAVIAQRSFRRPDGSLMPVSEERGHVDTNCLFFLAGTFHLLSIWVTMPKYLSSRGDRFFSKVLLSRNLRIARTGKPTVNYQCTFASVYRDLGEPLPPGAKEDPSDDFWSAVRQLSARQREIVFRLTGGLRFFK